MDFLYYRPLSQSAISIDNAMVDLCDDQKVLKFDESLIAYRPSTNYYLDEHTQSGILISGRILHLKSNISNSLIRLKEDILNENWPLSDEYNGIFSGIVFNENAFYIFNDPIGLFHLYYCISDEYVAVTTNLSAMHKLLNSKLNMSGLIMETMPGEFVQYGKSTVLKGVYTLLPGELIIKKIRKITIVNLILPLSRKIKRPQQPLLMNWWNLSTMIMNYILRASGI